MSSLLQCTDELLQQKAVQSSHYERLELQLRDRERRHRTAVLNLQQRLADVTRRSNDAADLRGESAQLTDQLTQHALQLAALQCRHAAAVKAQKAAVGRVEDGVRRWSGCPAQIVLTVHSLQIQQKLRVRAKDLLTVLWCLGHKLRLQHQICVFVQRCQHLSHQHASQVATLTQTLDVKRTAMEEKRAAALRAAEAAEEACAGPLWLERCVAEQTRVEWEARQVMRACYTESLGGRCELARAAVAALASIVDAEAQKLLTWEAKLRDVTASAAATAAALQRQEADHAEERTTLSQQHEQIVFEVVEGEERLTATKDETTHLAEARDAAQCRAHLALSQLLAAGFVTGLCEQLQKHSAAQQAAQLCERTAVQTTLAQLRVEHAEKLRVRHAAQVAAAHRQAAAALERHEAQQRHALADVEDSEWWLLHAQVVRDACRARAAAAVAAAEAAEAAETAKKSARGAKTRAAPGKRSRAGDQKAAPAAAPFTQASTTVVATKAESTVLTNGPSHAVSSRSSAAARRQRAALEAVDALTLTASQGHRAATASSYLAYKEGRSANSPSPNSRPSSPAAPLTAAPHTARTAYRLVSLKPSVTKQSFTDAVVDTGAAAGQLPRAKVAKHAHVTTAMSPFMTAASESDSSFSLMHDSSVTEEGAGAVLGVVKSNKYATYLNATGAPPQQKEAASNLTLAAKVSTGDKKNVGDTLSEASSDVRVSSPSSSNSSPPPRRPPGATRIFASAPLSQKRTRSAETNVPANPGSESDNAGVGARNLHRTFTSAGGSATSDAAGPRRTAALPRRQAPPSADDASRVDSGIRHHTVDSITHDAPRSALDAALRAARTPRSHAAAPQKSPVMYKAAAALGNTSALPAQSSAASGPGGGGAGAFTRGRPTLFPTGASSRRRAPPLMPTTTSTTADDLFADLFS